MRLRNIFFVFFSTFFLLADGRASADLVAHYSMNEGTGQTAYDVSGHENHGLIDGAQASCADAANNPDSMSGVCNTQITLEPGTYVDFSSPCGEYNSPEMLALRARELTQAAVPAEVKLHIRYRSDSFETITQLCTSGFATLLDSDPTEAVLTGVVADGRGSYVQQFPGDETFADIDFAPAF